MPRITLFPKTVILLLEPPELILDANMAREQHVKTGDTLRLSAVIKGIPFPKVSWKKEGREVSPKADIEVTGVGSKLEIRNTVHEDGGIYSLTVENPAGSKTVSVKVLVLGNHLFLYSMLLNILLQTKKVGKQKNMNRFQI